MSFLILLLAYMIHRRHELGLSAHLDAWIIRQVDRLKGERAVLGPRSAGWLVGVPLVLSVLLMAVLDDLFFGVVTLAVDFLALMACMGSVDLRPAVDQFLDAWKRKAWQSGYQHLQAAGFGDAESVQDREALVRRVALWYAERSVAEYFCIVFWFLMLGAPGAFFARVIILLNQCGRARWTRLEHVLFWLPVRLVVVALGLVGNFMGMLNKSLNDLIDPQAGWRRLLAAGLTGAMEGIASETGGSADTLVTARRLINLAFLVWMSLLAVMTLVGWMA